MACEKYSAWMTDAALSELAHGREPELLAHATGCDACRKAYQHAREVAAFVEGGIESLVSGQPSAHFNARLRARIAAEPAPSRYRSLFAWAPAAVAALALAAVILVLLMRSPHTSNRNSAAPIASQNAPSPPPAVAINPPSLPISAEPPRSSRVQRASRSVPSHSSEPEVLVQPGQFAAVLQYADALRSGRLNGEQLLAAQQPLEKPLEVTPIEIPLLETPKPEGDTPAPTENSGRL